MTKNPFINALAAVAYIVGLVSLMFYGIGPDGEREASIMMPIAMLSLLVLSVMVMSYTLLLAPIRLYFEEHKTKEAVTLFAQTLGVFAVCAAALVATLVIFF